MTDRREAVMRLMQGAGLVLLMLAGAALAQPEPGGPAPGQHEPMQHGPMMMHNPMMGGLGPSEPGPILSGQDAFGAVNEIVRILEADPDTDWSKVNLDALREHLIDMNEVTLHADAAVQWIDGGIRVAVTGSGRTLVAIQRMVPAHAREIDGEQGWQARTESLPDGVTLSVTSDDPGRVAEIIRGLGFIGVMASGAHHPMHHLMMAKGEPRP